MGRPKGSRNATKGTGLAKPTKHKRVTIEPAERMNAGRVIAPYRIMEALVAKECKHLQDARIAVAWRKGWPAVEDRIKLGQMKLASDCDRAYKNYDFLMLLNSEVYRNGASKEESLTMTIHHQLLRGAPALDREGEQKTDEKDRLCWKTRRPPIVEFPEIIKTYGIEKTLGLTAAAVALVRERSRPLLDALEDAFEKMGANKMAETTTEGETELTTPAAAKAWRRWPTSRLSEHGLPAGKLKLLEDAGLATMGRLLDKIRTCEDQEWWYKDIRGFGETGHDAMSEAIAKLRKADPGFQADAV